MARTMLLLTVLLAAVAPAHAATQAARVVALNAPAFLVRDGDTRALAPGAPLRAGDQLRTGPDGRVLLELAEGSEVKLGSQAEFTLGELEEREGGVFGGFMEVLRGAFRFTTTLLSSRNRRDLQVRVATVTAGIRGTDVWGRSNAEQDLVCLIEGSISVRHEDGPTRVMDEPLTFLVAPRGQPPLPVGPVDRAQLAGWAAETELLDGAGISEAAAPYVLHLQSTRTRPAAERLRERLDEAGYAAEVREATVGDSLWYRVSLAGLRDVVEARALGERLRESFGLQSSWVQRR